MFISASFFQDLKNNSMWIMKLLNRPFRYRWGFERTCGTRRENSANSTQLKNKLKVGYKLRVSCAYSWHCALNFLFVHKLDSKPYTPVIKNIILANYRTCSMVAWTFSSLEPSVSFVKTSENNPIPIN